MKDYSFRGKDETILRNKVTRPFLNPMKGSHNVDFMRALLADKDVYDAIKVNFPKVYGNYKEKQKFMSQLFTNLFRSNTLGKNLTMLNSEYN